MNWKEEAKDELKSYNMRRQAVHAIPQELLELENQRTALGSKGVNAPVKGGKVCWEDRQINLIARMDKLNSSLLCAKEWVDKVERGLEVLSEEDRLILDRFYIHPARGNLDLLCGELNLEKTAVYLRKDAALKRYTLARYGCLEI